MTTTATTAEPVSRLHVGRDNFAPCFTVYNTGNTEISFLQIILTAVWIHVEYRDIDFKAEN